MQRTCPSSEYPRQSNSWRELVTISTRAATGGTASSAAVRRVSQRPRSAYSRANHNAAVTAGSSQTPWNMDHRIFVAGSTAASSSAAPTAQSRMLSTCRAKGRAPGADRCRQA